MTRKSLILITLGLGLTACTDSARARLEAFGVAARITCHSGGKVIYDGCSTGRVSSQQDSDGWHFKDQQTGRLITVSGECLIDYGSPCPTAFIRPSAQ